MLIEFPITTIALDTRFDPKIVATALGWPEERQTRNGSVISAPGGRLYLFNFGAVVLEGAAELSPTERERIESAAQCRLMFQTKEVYTVVIDPENRGQRPRVGWDRVILRDRDPATMETVAYLLGQSAALDRYALVTDGLIAEAMKLSRTLSEGGRLPSLWSRPARKIGDIIYQQLELARWFIQLDPPESAWENSDIFELYQQLSENLDLRDRHEELRNKLDAVENALATILNLWQSRQSWTLEAAIVGLILLEIALAWWNKA